MTIRTFLNEARYLNAIIDIKKKNNSLTMVKENFMTTVTPFHTKTNQRNHYHISASGGNLYIRRQFYFRDKDFRLPTATKNS